MKAAFGTSIRIEIQLRIVADDSSVISEGEILYFDKGDDESNRNRGMFVVWAGEDG